MDHPRQPAVRRADRGRADQQIKSAGTAIGTLQSYPQHNSRWQLYCAFLVLNMLITETG